MEFYRRGGSGLYLGGETDQNEIPAGGEYSEAHSVQYNDNHSLTIICDACGTRQSRDVDWLHDMSHLPCPGCGNEIDLRKEPWKGEIQRLWNAAHDRGPARRRLP